MVGQIGDNTYTFSWQHYTDLIVLSPNARRSSLKTVIFSIHHYRNQDYSHMDVTRRVEGLETIAVNCELKAMFRETILHSSFGHRGAQIPSLIVTPSISYVCC